MEEIKIWLSQFQGPQFYAIYTVILMLCGCWFPMNSDLVIITASVMGALTGNYQISLLILFAWIGLLLGDTINFNVARRWGVKVLESPRFSKIINRNKIESMRSLIQRKGEGFIFFVRFLPLIRTPIFFSAGLLKVRTSKFYLYNGISTAVYLFIVIPLAFRTANNIDVLIAGIKKFQFGLLAILIGILFFVFRKKNSLSR